MSEPLEYLESSMERLPEKLISKIRNVKLIATDLDGTLLDDLGKTTEVTRKSVSRLQALGFRVAIMTGRAHSSAERIADELGIDSPIISLDGGLVKLPHSDGSIFASYIKPKLVSAAIEEAGKTFSSIALFTDGRLVRLESDTMLPGYIDNLDLDTQVVEDLQSFAGRSIRFIVGSDSREIIRRLVRKTIGFFSNARAEVFRSSRHDDRWYLEVKNRECSKATGLVHLEKYFKVKKKEVAVIGDFRNDLEAFKHAGIGIAMRNAVGELKERADLVTKSTNNDNGAAEFLDLFCEVRNN